MNKLTGLLACVATVALIGSANAAMLTLQFETSFTPNPNSVLQGLTGVGGGGFGVTEGSNVGLTQFTNPANAGVWPNAIFGQDGGVQSSITYDLGAEGAATRQLDSLTIVGITVDRYSMAFGVYTSLDGISYTPSGPIWDTNYFSNFMASNPNYPLYNTATFSFGAGEVVGVRYIQFVNYTNEWSSPRIAQLEATTTAVPEPSTTVLAVLALSGFVLWKARQFRKA